MDAKAWPFSDPPNVAVFADKRILENNAAVLYVDHDLEDGAWQFHGQGEKVDGAEVSIVALRTIVLVDPSVQALADLPVGWCAWRETRSSPWQRAVRDRADHSDQS